MVHTSFPNVFDSMLLLIKKNSCVMNNKSVNFMLNMEINTFTGKSHLKVLDSNDINVQNSTFIINILNINQLMNQFSKQSDFNQSVDQSQEQSLLSGKDNSSSNHKATIFQASLSYRNNDWLIKLIQLNPHKKNLIIDWVFSLSHYLMTKTWKHMQNITSLNFHPLETSRQRYFIFIEQFTQFFCLLKIIDQNGVIVSFKIYQNSQKQPCLSKILKKISKKVPVFIFDHTNDCSYLKKVIQKRNFINVAIFINEPFCLFLANNQKWILMKVSINQVNYNFYYNIRKKFDNNFQDIEKIIVKQLENIPKLRQIYNDTLFLTTNSVESLFLLQNILNSSLQEVNSATVINILNEGLSGLRLHQQKWQTTENKHLPGSGVVKKGKCNYCHRKKSDLICLGCTYVYGKEIHICIGECFHKFHEDRKMFMKKQKMQICKNIVFFDKKCKQIGNAIDQLIDEENGGYLQFIDYLQSKMIKSLNKLISRQYALDNQQGDANE